ncbi:MAG: thioredoxin-like domain-containing protein [Bacteroidota bacterium]|nr:thioredoxin-like domain-containing protein [Bacteroidota bacterium]
MKKTCFLVLLTVITVACNNENNIIISGTHPDSTHEYLHVNRLNLNNLVFVDSARINRSGKFKIKIENPEPAFYTLGYNDNEFVTVVAEPGDRINLQFKGKKLQNEYTVEGSEESEKVRILDKKLGQTIIILYSLTTEYEAITEKEDNLERAAEIEEKYANILNEQRKYNIGFILDNLSKLSAVKALYQKINENTFVLYQQRDLQYLKLVSDSLGKYYPGISLTKSLKENLDDEINQMYISRISQATEGLTPVNLDANLLDISGKRVRLSDLTKDNYVLLSFWSAESKECISNNLFLKQMYKLYHKQGFQIYQVNLDSDESLWKSSVKFDELPWINVREDDPSNPVTARMFNVSSLPANYLLDMNGEIIGKDLFGRSLRIKLGQIFD